MRKKNKRIRTALQPDFANLAVDQASGFAVGRFT